MGHQSQERNFSSFPSPCLKQLICKGEVVYYSAALCMLAFVT